MKKIAFLFIFASAVFTFGCSTPSVHVTTPETVLDRVPASIESCAELISNIISNNKIPKKHYDEVITLLRDIGVAESKAEEVKSYGEALNLAYDKVVGAGTTSVKKSEKLVEFGKVLRELYVDSKLKNEEIMDLDFILGRNILKAEQFTGKEFKIIKEEDFALGRNEKMLHINYKQYKKYTLAFEKNEPPYTTAIAASNQNVINRIDIRQMETHNLFPVYFGHDMTHVRYALNHERYFPMLFGASRSKNHLRYVMMGALAEGVDRAQYSEERILCRYFRDIKKLNLEEGVLWIARASEQDLIDVATEIGKKDIFVELAKDFEGWAPVASKKYPTMGVSGLKLDEELDQIFGEMREYHTDPDLVEMYKKRKSEILVSGD
ncbi:MAG: hypothetical protein WC635_17605 [Bacteriovorax sp.]|jgi:hypothetical protein